MGARSTLQAFIGPQASLDEALAGLRQIALSAAATPQSSMLTSTGVLPNRTALLRGLRAHTLKAYQVTQVTLQAQALADLLSAYRPATLEAAPIPAAPPEATPPARQLTILDAALRAVEDLPGRIRALLNVEGGSGLLKAEFLVSQLLTVLVLVLTLSIDEAGGAEEAAILQQLASGQTAMIQLMADIRREQLRQRQSLYVVGGRPVNLRAAPRFRAGVMTPVYPGVQVRRLAARGPWAQVEALDLVTGEVRVGWCLKKYLRRARFPRP